MHQSTDVVLSHDHWTDATVRETRRHRVGQLGGGYNNDSTSIPLFHYHSTPIRLQFDHATTIRRPTLRP